jgi:hypothetical protein
MDLFIPRVYMICSMYVFFHSSVFQKQQFIKKNLSSDQQYLFSYRCSLEYI